MNDYMMSVTALQEAGIQYVPVTQGNFDKLSQEMLINLIQEDMILNSVDVPFQIEGSKEFWKLIDSLINEHISITKEHILEASKNTDLNQSYLRQIYPQIDDIIQESVPDIKAYTEKFYNAGKSAGFSELGVKAFTGAADTNAMFHLTNYNYELIRKLTDDLAAGVRQEVWQGVAHDRGMKEIAKRIEKVKDEVVLRRGNRVWTIAERAKLQAITESARARHQGMYMSYAEYGVTHYNLVNSGWGKVCDICKDKAANGPYKLSDKSAWPPIHPLCACYTEPVEDPSETASDPNEFMNMVSGEIEQVNRSLVFSI